MWISREDYQQLLEDRAEADLRAVAAEQSLAAARKLHIAQLRELHRRVRVAEKREAQAVEMALSERQENREAERHWANMLLRAKQSYPLAHKSDAAEVTEPAEVQPRTEAMDPGEYEAILAQAAEYGVNRADVDRLLARERGE